MKNIKFNLIYCILAVAGAILIAIANHSLAKTDPNRDIAGLFNLVCPDFINASPKLILVVR